MNCLLEGNFVKVFGKAIHALSRVGDELWFDPMVDGLALRSVNSAHSAYACFLFSPLFFQSYKLKSSSERGTAPVNCRLTMKCLLPLFRCLTSVERNVERCQILIGSPSDQVMIQFFCRHGITKTHNLRFHESEALQALFASHLCPNLLKASARLLTDMVLHFPSSQEEITLSISPPRVSLKNYNEPGEGHMTMTNTELSVHPDEFHCLQIREDAHITFCLKELRGFLSFAESLCLQVSVHCSAAGKPVCFSVEDTLLEATVVLATLMDSDSRDPPEPTETQPRAVPRCAEAADLPVSSHEANLREPVDISDLTELVESSQGSPIIHPPAPMMLPHAEGRFGPEDYTSAPSTPASSMVCSLLFQASSSEKDDGCDANTPVLACYSDEEEKMEEEFTAGLSV